jgi:hypothetical protein
MPPASGHSTANHQAQRWIDSIVAFQPIVQRQNERGALAGGAAVDDLLDLALAAVAADGQDRGAVHREQQRRAVQEDDRQRVERVVERGCRSAARTQRSSPGAGRCRRARLAPAAHQHRAEEAEHQEEPDRRGEGPGDVRAQCRARARAGRCASTTAGPRPVSRPEAISHQPPCVQRRQAQPVLRRRRLQREPEQLPDELRSGPSPPRPAC